MRRRGDPHDDPKAGRRTPLAPATRAATLGDAPWPRIRVECRKCGRRGDYSPARLIERHGAGLTLPNLLPILSADCPRRLENLITDQCSIVFSPQCRLG